jgi:hypothetical protein
MNARRTRIFASTALAAVFSLGLLAMPVAAQDAGGETPSFTDQQLESYAQAAIQVSGVIQEWQPQIMEAREAGEEERAADLTEAANEELLSTIQNADGISVEEYQEISVAARQDEDLYNELNDLVQSMQEQ